MTATKHFNIYSCLVSGVGEGRHGDQFQIIADFLNKHNPNNNYTRQEVAKVAHSTKW